MYALCIASPSKKRATVSPYERTPSGSRRGWGPVSAEGGGGQPRFAKAHLEHDRCGVCSPAASPRGGAPTSRDEAHGNRLAIDEFLRTDAE
jgi:hypothetical protein